MALTERDLRGNTLRRIDLNLKNSRDLNESDCSFRNPKPSTYFPPQICNSPRFLSVRPPEPETKRKVSAIQAPRDLPASSSVSSSFSFSLRSKKISYVPGKPSQNFSSYLSRKFSSSLHMARVSNMASTPSSPPSGQTVKDKSETSKVNPRGKEKDASRENGRDNDKEKGAVKSKFWKSVFSLTAPLSPWKSFSHSSKNSELPEISTWQERSVPNRLKKRTGWRKVLYADSLGAEGTTKEASALSENKLNASKGPLSPSSKFPVTAVTNDETVVPMTAADNNGYLTSNIRAVGNLASLTPLQVDNFPAASGPSGEWTSACEGNGRNGFGLGNGYGYGGGNCYEEGFGNSSHGAGGDSSWGKKTTREMPLMVQRPIFQPEEYVKRGRKDPTKRRSHRKSLSDGYISVEEAEGGMVAEGFSHFPPHQFDSLLTRKEIEDVIFAVYQQKVAKSGREYLSPEDPSSSGSRGRGERGVGKGGRGGTNMGAQEFYGNGGFKNKSMGVYGGNASLGANGELEVSPRIRVNSRSPISDKHKWAACGVDPTSALSEQRGLRGGTEGAQRRDGRDGKGPRELFSELDGGNEYERRNFRKMRRRKSHRESISDGYVSPSEEDEEAGCVGEIDKYSFRRRHLSPSRLPSRVLSRIDGRSEVGRGVGECRDNEKIVIRASGNRVIKVAMAEGAVDESEIIEISCSPKSPSMIDLGRGEVEERISGGRREKGQSLSKRSSPNQSSVPSSPHGITPLRVMRETEVESSEDEKPGPMDRVEGGVRGSVVVKGAMKRSQSDRLLPRQAEIEEDSYWRESVPGEDSSASRIGGFSSSQDESSVSQSSLRRRERRKKYDGDYKVRRKVRGRIKRVVTGEEERKDGFQSRSELTVGRQFGEGGEGGEEVDSVAEVPQTRNEKRKQLLEELRRWDWKEEKEGAKKVQYQISERC